MSPFDCLRPQVPPLTRGARIVRGAASIPIAEAERTNPAARAVGPAKTGRPKQYHLAATDPDLELLVRHLRALGTVSYPTLVRATGIPLGKVRYLMHAAKSLGLAEGREGRLWSAKA